MQAEVRELKRANEMADSSGQRKDLRELLGGCHVSEGLVGSTVEAVLHGLELRGGDGRQVGALGQVLAEEAVGVLVAATLPGECGSQK